MLRILIFVSVLSLMNQSGTAFETIFLDRQEFAEYLKSQPPYPFCQQPPKSDDFSFDFLEENPHINMDDRNSSLSMTLDYKGKCVLWQYYSEPADQIIVGVRGDDKVLSQTMAIRQMEISAQRLAQRRHPFINGLEPQRVKFDGISFSGEYSPAEVRKQYEDEDIYFQKNKTITQKEMDMQWEAMDLLRREQLDHLTFVKNQISIPIPLCQYYSFTAKKGYAIRVGYLVYPETKWNAFSKPLNKCFVAWSTYRQLIVE